MSIPQTFLHICTSMGAGEAVKRRSPGAVTCEKLRRHLSFRRWTYSVNQCSSLVVSHWDKDSSLCKCPIGVSLIAFMHNTYLRGSIVEGENKSSRFCMQRLLGEGLCSPKKKTFSRYTSANNKSLEQQPQQSVS